MRLGAIFVAICILIIAVSVGATGYFYFGVSPSQASAIAVATLTALAIYNAASTRLGLRTAVGRQLPICPAAEPTSLARSPRWGDGWRRSKARSNPLWIGPER